jgi:prophage regulatory protein
MELVRIRDVLKMSGTCRATVYEWMRKGLFPRPIIIGTRTVAWRKPDLLAWQASRDAPQYRMREGCVPMELETQTQALK